jgi:hypothetical protein
LSQSIGDRSSDARVSPTLLPHGVQVGPPTPISSPVRAGTATQDKGKKRQIDHHDWIPQEQWPKPTLESMQITLSTNKLHSAVLNISMSNEAATPFADVNNVLGKRRRPLTSPRPSTPRRSLEVSPKYRKRRRRNMSPSAENKSPVSDHSLEPSSYDACDHTTGYSTKMVDGVTASSARVIRGIRASSLEPALSPKGRTSPLCGKSPTSPKDDRIEMVLDAAAERFQIANKLFHARPDLVTNSYTPKRARQLSWSMKLEARKEYRDCLHSMHRPSIVNTTRPAGRRIPSKDTAGDNNEMDWEHSRTLTNNVLEQLGRGEPVSLPDLVCLSSQNPGAS